MLAIVTTPPCQVVAAVIDTAIDPVKGAVEMIRRPKDKKVAELRRLPAFSNEPMRRMADAGRALDLISVPQGEVLMRQGEVGHDFYLIIEGMARVERDGEVVANVTHGAIIGELALVGAGQRTATVVADTDMVLATGSRPSFAALVAEYPSFGAQVRRSAEARLVEVA